MCGGGAVHVLITIGHECLPCTPLAPCRLQFYCYPNPDTSHPLAGPRPPAASLCPCSRPLLQHCSTAALPGLRPALYLTTVTSASQAGWAVQDELCSGTGMARLWRAGDRSGARDGATCLEGSGNGGGREGRAVSAAHCIIGNLPCTLPAKGWGIAAEKRLGNGGRRGGSCKEAGQPSPAAG